MFLASSSDPEIPNPDQNWYQHKKNKKYKEKEAPQKVKHEIPATKTRPPLLLLKKGKSTILQKLKETKWNQNFPFPRRKEIKTRSPTLAKFKRSEKYLNWKRPEVSTKKQQSYPIPPFRQSRSQEIWEKIRGHENSDFLLWQEYSFVFHWTFLINSSCPLLYMLFLWMFHPFFSPSVLLFSSFFFHLSPLSATHSSIFFSFSYTFPSSRGLAIKHRVNNPICPQTDTGHKHRWNKENSAPGWPFLFVLLDFFFPFFNKFSPIYEQVFALSRFNHCKIPPSI